jgi:ribosomal protein S18 acetylase RimI-like enzyme
VTRRANSALAVGADGHLAELVNEVERFYEERGAPSLFQITSASAWTILSTDTPTDEWFNVYWEVESAKGHEPSAAGICREVLLHPACPARYVSAADGDQVFAVGKVVIEGEWGGVQCMATMPSMRRRSGAQTVLHQLAVEADAAGASQMYLGVMADNGGAQALYTRAGFRTAHEYSYFGQP